MLYAFVVLFLALFFSMSYTAYSFFFFVWLLSAYIPTMHNLCIHFLNYSIDYVYRCAMNQTNYQVKMFHIWNANKCVNLSTKVATPYSKSISSCVVFLVLCWVYGMRMSSLNIVALFYFIFGDDIIRYVCRYCAWNV